MANEINKLSEQFLRMYPLKDVAMKPVVDHLLTLSYDDSMNFQQQLLCSTLRHPVVLKYPPTPTYCQRFLKILLTKIEEVNHEVCDDLYVAYTDILSQDSLQNCDSNSHCYRTYCLAADLTLTLKETQKIISEGTTGMFTWEASHVLAEWCQKESARLCGKSIVELGAGLGLTGLTVIKRCHPESYTFTDLHTTVLKTLKENILINLGDESSAIKNSSDDSWDDDFKMTYKGTNLSVDRLDWIDDHFNICCDVILAADVVYDTDIIPPLVDILKEGLSRKVGATAYIASTIRNFETFNFFRTTLAMKDVKICSESLHIYKESPSQLESSVVLLHLIL